MTNIVSGAVSTVTDLGKDEVWLQGWLKEQPSRLGLGDLEVTDGVADEDERSFVATDDDRCFSVDVQLGEMEASRGFQVLDNWARNRVRHPDKAHVAVLVTEIISDRYETTLQTLADHLPLVVVELQVWKGENEAIVVPHVALASDEVDLSDTPAAKAAEVAARVADETEAEDAVADAALADDADADEAVADEQFEATDASDDDESDGGVVTEAEAVAAEAEAEAVAAEAEAQAEADAETSDEHDDKDDTGVGNPWGLAGAEAEDSQDNGANPLLDKVG